MKTIVKEVPDGKVVTFNINQSINKIGVVDVDPDLRARVKALAIAGMAEESLVKSGRLLALKPEIKRRTQIHSKTKMDSEEEYRYKIKVRRGLFISGSGD